MKQLYYTGLLFLILSLVACRSTKQSLQSEAVLEAQKRLIESYLNATKDDQTQAPQLVNYFSPKRIASEQLSDFRLNRYYQTEFRFLRLDLPSKTLYYEVSNRSQGWKHELAFVCELEQQRWYLKPGDKLAELRFVNPWVAARTFLP